MATDLSARLTEAYEKLLNLQEHLDLSNKKDELSKLEKESQDPHLWDNRERAQKIMIRQSALRDAISSYEALKKRTEDTLEMLDIAEDSMMAELGTEIGQIEDEIDRLELNTLLSGKYDRGNALLAIHAGAGGTDSQDWAEMLERMYLRWAEAHGYQTDILDQTDGEEAGIKSATIGVSGPLAYGYLRPEKGVHRLVRLSPFDAAHRRHTSFALVEVLPEFNEANEITIPPDDIKIDVYKSSGAGGQNVQKNATAVRLTHIPTGLVVTCQNERSQVQNRENALRVLKARLLEMKQEAQAEKISELRGEYTKAEWGSQIRSYVLHPYQLVKDHRTEHETGDTQSVLDGDLDPFIEAYLRKTD
ncbi:MAG: peptide chain release factor 2 [Chloroflexota bacterium]|nr:peptide chain release factor 2 [Chloroflexota bacterium]